MKVLMLPPTCCSRVPNAPPLPGVVGREVASKTYDRPSSAMVVPLKRLYCGRNEYPFDLRPLNTDVASVVRQALALSEDRDETRSEILAISSLVARANASP